MRVREGIEGLIPQNDLVLAKDETGKDKPLREGDEIEAEIANIDTQERRLTLSMRRGETAPAATAEAPAATGGAAKPARTTKAPKKSAAAEAASGGTIGELIKQKLGAKLATISTEKDKKDDDEDGKDE